MPISALGTTDTSPHTVASVGSMASRPRKAESGSQDAAGAQRPGSVGRGLPCPLASHSHHNLTREWGNGEPFSTSPTMSTPEEHRAGPCMAPVVSGQPAQAPGPPADTGASTRQARGRGDEWSPPQEEAEGCAGQFYSAGNQSGQALLSLGPAPAREVITSAAGDPEPPRHVTLCSSSRGS